MKPLTLTMQNFGPYQNETIDFKRLVQIPLFLITGPTGSGKTTIFDAMTFALYGLGASDERDVESMRSDFAGPDDVTSVEFSFEHQGLTYKVTRAPKQLRNKKRGTGQKEYPASGKLQVFKDGQQQSETTKLQTINMTIESALQISRSQFTQIVLLPQGDFRRFLMASSNDKEAVLRKIFKTQLYQRWGDSLKEQLKADRNQTKDWQTEIERDLQTVHWDVEPASDVSVADRIQALKQQQSTAKQAVDQLERNAQEQSKRLASQQQEYVAAEKMNQQLATLSAAETELASLKEQAPAFAELERTIVAQRWVQQTSPKHERVVELKHQLAGIEAKQTANQLAQKEAQTELDTASHALAVVQAADTQFKGQAERVSILTHQRPQFERVLELTQLVEKRHAQERSLAATVAEQESQINAAKQALAKLADQQATIQQLERQRASLTNEGAQIKQHLEWGHRLAQQAKQIQMLEQSRTQVENTIEKQVQLANQAGQRYDELHDQSIQAQINQLVKQLKQGAPCPICGSTDHPHPAVESDIATVDTQTIQSAQEDYQTHLTKLAALRSKRTATVDQIAQQQAQMKAELAELIAAAEQSGVPVEGSLTVVVDQLAARLKDDKDHQQGLEHQLQAAQASQARATELKDTVDAGNDKVATLEQQHQAALNDYHSLSGRLSDAKDGLPDGYSDLAALDAEINQLTATVKHHEQSRSDGEQAVAKAKTRLSQLTVLAGELAEQSTQVAAERDERQAQLKHLIEERFGSDGEGQFERTMATLGDLDANQTRLDQYQDQIKEQQTRVATYQKLVGDHQAVDLSTLATHISALQRTNVDLTKQLKDANGRFILNQRILEQVQANMHHIDGHEQRLNELTLLAETINGKGPTKLSLERYVLQARLQEIILVANRYLADFSDERYQLLPHTGTGANQKDTGLEIDVYDDNVGQSRSVHTLSGGESFIAALSLALALGEVIQSESGGISIDALFIDEGFGSLDADSLRVAMAALSRIESADRVIGIISHVAMLKEQIPWQLQIRPNGGGQSTTRLLMP